MNFDFNFEYKILDIYPIGFIAEMYNAKEKGVPKKCHLGVNASKSKIKIIRNMISATKNFTRKRKLIIFNHISDSEKISRKAKTKPTA